MHKLCILHDCLYMDKHYMYFLCLFYVERSFILHGYFIRIILMHFLVWLHIAKQFVLCDRDDCIMDKPYVLSRLILYGYI